MTHICLSAVPSPPGAARSDPELRELSRCALGWPCVVSGRTSQPRKASPVVLWPCHFSRLLEPGTLREPAKRTNKLRTHIVVSSVRSMMYRRRNITGIGGTNCEDHNSQKSPTRSRTPAMTAGRSANRSADVSSGLLHSSFLSFQCS